MNRLRAFVDALSRDESRALPGASRIGAVRAVLKEAPRCSIA